MNRSEAVSFAHADEFFIGGRWVAPLGTATRTVINPATETQVARIALGSAADVDRAVAAAKAAFPGSAALPLSRRIELIKRLRAEFEARLDLFARRMTLEMGSPATYSRNAQAALPLLHFDSAIAAVENFTFRKREGSSLVVKEPIGVCGLITPWNFPLNTLVPKVVPALLAGCTVVLKPSELSPLSALLFAEAIEAAGFPAGMFNLINGDGGTVGRALAGHPDVAMISITGSVAAGVDVARTAADTVKRVHQELGGKSGNILLADADFEKAVPLSVAACFRNSGQSCSAPTRLLAPRSRLGEVEALARAAAEAMTVGDPDDPNTQLGPVISSAQYERVQHLIETALAEGGRLIIGGTGRPGNLAVGHFVKPTIISDVSADMTIAQEEVFGPVLTILPYDTEDDAVAIANGTRYGLAAYIQSADHERAARLASRLQAGTVHINFPPYDTRVPFGGFKQSGNGREYGAYGLDEFLELKSITGYFAASESNADASMKEASAEAAQ